MSTQQRSESSWHRWYATFSGSNVILLTPRMAEGPAGNMVLKLADVYDWGDPTLKSVLRLQKAR